MSGSWYQGLIHELFDTISSLILMLDLEHVGNFDLVVYSGLFEILSIFRWTSRIDILFIVIFGLVITGFICLNIAHYAVILHKLPMIWHSLTSLSSHHILSGSKLIQIITASTLFLDFFRNHILQFFDIRFLLLQGFISKKVRNTLLPEKLFWHITTSIAYSTFRRLQSFLDIYG